MNVREISGHREALTIDPLRCMINQYSCFAINYYLAMAIVIHVPRTQLNLPFRWPSLVSTNG